MKSLWLIIISLVLLIIQCSFSKDQPVARVGNEMLPQTGVDLTSYEHLPDSTRALALLNYVNNWVDQELLCQEAKRQKMKLSPALDAELERIRKAMLVNLFLKDKIDQIITVSDQETQIFYEENQIDFTATSDYYKFLALKTSESSLGQILDREIKNGASIIYLYEKYPERCNLVSIGRNFLPTKEMNEEFAAVLHKQKDRKEYVKSQVNGESYFIKVLDYIEEGKVKYFELVEHEIRTLLTHRKRTEKYNDLIKRLRENSTFEINMNLIINLGDNR